MKRFAASLLVVCLLHDAVFGALAETSFWRERQKNFSPSPSPAFSSVLERLLTAIPADSLRIDEISKNGSATRAVVLLKDIHMVPVAQQELAKGLLSLIQHGHIETLGVEGAFEKFRFDRFWSFPDQKLVNDIAADFIRDNLMGAGGYAGLIAHSSTLKVVGVDDRLLHGKNVQAYRNGKKRQARLLARLAGLDGAIQSDLANLNPQLQSFLRARHMYRDRQIALNAYVSALDRLANGRAPALRHLLDMLNIETRLRRQEELRRSELLSYARFLQTTFGSGEEKIEAAVTQGEAYCLRQFAVTKTEREKAEKDDQLYLLKRLVSFELTPEEWIRYQNIFKTTGLLLCEGSSWRADAAPFEDFYRAADARSDLIAENFAQNIQDTGALVVGGFHIERIAKLLSAQKIPYIIVSPKLGAPDVVSANHYLSEFDRDEDSFLKMSSAYQVVLPSSQVNGLGTSDAPKINISLLSFAAVSHFVRRGAASVRPAHMQVVRRTKNIFRVRLQTRSPNKSIIVWVSNSLGTLTPHTLLHSGLFSLWSRPPTSAQLQTHPTSLWALALLSLAIQVLTVVSIPQYFFPVSITNINAAWRPLSALALLCAGFYVAVIRQYRLNQALRIEEAKAPLHEPDYFPSNFGQLFLAALTLLPLSFALIGSQVAFQYFFVEKYIGGSIGAAIGACVTLLARWAQAKRGHPVRRLALFDLVVNSPLIAAVISHAYDLNPTNFRVVFSVAFAIAAALVDEGVSKLFPKRFASKRPEMMVRISPSMTRFLLVFMMLLNWSVTLIVARISPNMIVWNLTKLHSVHVVGGIAFALFVIILSYFKAIPMGLIFLAAGYGINSTEFLLNQSILDPLRFFDADPNLADLMMSIGMGLFAFKVTKLLAEVAHLNAAMKRENPIKAKSRKLKDGPFGILWKRSNIDPRHWKMQAIGLLLSAVFFGTPVHLLVKERSAMNKGASNYSMIGIKEDRAEMDRRAELSRSMAPKVILVIGTNVTPNIERIVRDVNEILAGSDRSSVQPCYFTIMTPVVDDHGTRELRMVFDSVAVVQHEGETLREALQRTINLSYSIGNRRGVVSAARIYKLHTNLRYLTSYLSDLRPERQVELRFFSEQTKLIWDRYVEIDNKQKRGEKLADGEQEQLEVQLGALEKLFDGLGNRDSTPVFPLGDQDLTEKALDTILGRYSHSSLALPRPSPIVIPMSVGRRAAESA